MTATKKMPLARDEPASDGAEKGLGGRSSERDSITKPGATQTSLSQDMMREALWYAGRGVSVFPVHEPLFNHPLGYTCSCEEWRHGDWGRVAIT